MISREASAPDGRAADHTGNTKVLIAFVLTTFNVFITVSSLNNILPVLAAHFGVTASDISFITIIYSLVVSGLSLPFGRLGDQIGFDKVFISGNILFTIAIALSGIFSGSLFSIVAIRMLMGVGASMVQSVSQALLIRSYPANERGKAAGLCNTFVSCTSIFAPVLGSVVCNLFGWRVSFVMMLPVGIAAIVLNFKFIRRFQGSGARSDLPGTILFILFLTPLMLFFNKHKLAWITSAVGAALLGLSVLALVVLIWHEGRCKYPLLKFSLFSDPRFAIASICVLLCYIATNASHLALPFYLQDALGISTNVSSIIVIVFNISMTMFTTFFGSLSDKVGAAKMGIMGMLVMLVAMVMIVFYDTDTPMAFIVVSQAIQGIGSAMFMSPCCSILMGVTPKEDSGLASAMIATMRNLAGAVGGTLYSVIIAARSQVFEQTGLYSASQVYTKAQSNFSLVNMGAVFTAVVLMAVLRALVKKHPVPEC